MDDVFVAQLMTSDPETVAQDTLVEDAANTMLDRGIGSVLVVDDDDRLRGILTTTDFVKIVAERKPKDETPVSEYMSTEVLTTNAQEPIEEVANRMLEAGIHHMPVVDDDGTPMGIVTTTDLAAYVSTIYDPSPN
ncbi:CBS domain-containing protein [Halorubellus sp. JP-L1]|uniref:CBS domain-containing protein n=1 Tax=Halorubellus sp. JP-L1 TaxID=2715753 RepID=UPI00140E2A7C|nr:CBS domain-containing protein [Halorubellus sp. JP-L1]NHN43132.1 CBS domain-containing protein [Halorubellus sp. JP-L1]